MTWDSGEREGNLSCNDEVGEGRRKESFPYFMYKRWKSVSMGDYLYPVGRVDGTSVFSDAFDGNGVIAR